MKPIFSFWIALVTYVFEHFNQKPMFLGFFYKKKRTLSSLQSNKVNQLRVFYYTKTLFECRLPSNNLLLSNIFLAV